MMVRRRSFVHAAAVLLATPAIAANESARVLRFVPPADLASGLAWRITLRDGLVFHDGERVLARDFSASIRRWGVRDPSVRPCLQRPMKSQPQGTMLIRLRQPSPLLGDALGRMAPHMYSIMRERLAATDPYKQVSEMVGSGPYRFKPDERVPGARLVYERSSRYAQP